MSSRKTLNEKDRKRSQVRTTKERHGEDFYSRNAKKSRENATTMFNSDTAKKAVNARWKKHREEKAKELKEKKDVQEEKR